MGPRRSLVAATQQPPMLAHPVRTRVVIERQAQGQGASGGGERQVARALRALRRSGRARSPPSRARSATAGRRRATVRRAASPTARVDDVRGVAGGAQQEAAPPSLDHVDAPVPLAAPRRRRARATPDRVAGSHPQNVGEQERGATSEACAQRAHGLQLGERVAPGQRRRRAARSPRPSRRSGEPRSRARSSAISACAGQPLTSREYSSTISCSLTGALMSERTGSRSTLPSSASKSVCSQPLTEPVSSVLAAATSRTGPRIATALAGLDQERGDVDLAAVHESRGRG